MLVPGKAGISRGEPCSEKSFVTAKTALRSPKFLSVKILISHAKVNGTIGLVT